MRTAIVVCVSALVLSCSANEPPGFAPEPDAGVGRAAGRGGRAGQ
jgi:hypothetical protein